MKDRILFTLLVTTVIALCTLGTWQLSRLTEKRQLIAQMSFHQKQPYIMINSYDDLQQFRKISVIGKFVGERFFIGPRYFYDKNHKKFVGYRIFQLFNIKDRYIFVDRGIGKTKNDAVSDKTQVNGTLLKPQGKTFYLTNNPQKNEYTYPDLKEMFAHSAIDGKLITELYLSDDSDGVRLPVAFRNDHLQYAITWYSMAIGLILMYFYGRKTR